MTIFRGLLMAWWIMVIFKAISSYQTFLRAKELGAPLDGASQLLSQALVGAVAGGIVTLVWLSVLGVKHYMGREIDKRVAEGIAKERGDHKLEG
ncbi:hypothetical protein [Paraferrimonas sedimenticola]|uniref:Uncharacterized protein n=1 Tax=Paraferrimonas sedimenticola TaxID=375674 RepID=A0AA37RSM3_9GAMM|nr:hypothetical protein [Paraferrimonas sedimenticola]GLP95273.1 hypothetical protein GCM10007895_05790 [Paraferrimonas sedimenticola]